MLHYIKYRIKAAFTALIYKQKRHSLIRLSHKHQNVAISVIVCPKDSCDNKAIKQNTSKSKRRTEQ